MPYKDPERQAQVTREWVAARKRAWLAEHPCACGQPAVAVVASHGAVPKGLFSWRTERRDAALAAVEAKALCTECRAAWWEEAKAALRAREPAPVVPRAVQAAQAAQAPARVRARRMPVPPSLPEPSFDRKAWREERRESLGYSRTLKAT